MSTPTSYDLIQDDEIQGLKDIVTTSYQPPSDTEYSYPVVDQPMNDAQWMRIMRGIGSAIIDEVGDGAPFILKSVNDANRTITIGSSAESGESVCLIQGIAHLLEGDTALEIPYPTIPTTYNIGSEFDPLRQREEGGPIRLAVWDTANPPIQGKIRLPHLELKWSPNQTLSEAVTRSMRRQLSAAIVVDARTQLSDTDQMLWGTRALVWTTGEELLFRDGWKSITDPPWSNINIGGGYEVFKPGLTPQFRPLGDGTIETRGCIKKSSGSFNKAVPSYFANIPGIEWEREQFRPAAGTAGRGLRIDTTSGGTGNRELSYYTDDDMSWLSLDGMKFYVK